MNSLEFISALAVLKEEYPGWQAPVVTLIAVHTNDPYRVLISTVISLRTQDQVTAAASTRLFEQAPSVNDLDRLTDSEIAALIYPAGFYQRKAVQIKEIARLLITIFNGQVPATREELLSLPGVGRKTANLVLSLAYHQPAICVDTHVHRISNRWGMVKTKTPEETEFALMQALPENIWREINDLLVAFGQTICRPVGPKCEKCRLKKCPSRRRDYLVQSAE